MRPTALFAAVPLLTLLASLGGCPQSDGTETGTTPDSDTDALPAPSPTTGDQGPDGRRPGVNPLAPMPVPIEIPQLRSADRYWTNAAGRVGWFSDPADGAPLPGADEVVGGVPPVRQAAEKRTNDFADPTAALEFAARQFDAVARVFSLYGEMGSPSFWYEPLMLTQWGKCPRVTVISGETTAIIPLQYRQ